MSNDDIGDDRRLAMFRTQLLIRETENRVQDLYLQNLVKGTTHLMVGQEAVSAGVGHAMAPADRIFCTYRGHGHVLARGVPVDKVLGEIMGRQNGLMRGKGGSMHLTSVAHGVMGSFAIIGAHLVMACGSAWRAQYLGHDDVTVCVFGDGTTNIGAFHEALNLAAIWKLPVVFVCENNLYQEYSRIEDMTAVQYPAADRAGSYGLDRIVIDGNDADEVYRTMTAVLARARAGDGPSVVEALTYRQSGHSRSDPAKYRPPGELEAWKLRDPLTIYEARLREHKVAKSILQDLKDDVRQEVDAAESVSRSSPPPGADLIFADVYADGGWAWRN